MRNQEQQEKLDENAQEVEDFFKSNPDRVLRIEMKELVVD